MAAYGLLELVSRLIQALSIVLLAASFDKPQFGIFYSYLAIYQFVTVLGSGGLTESLMRRLANRGVEETAQEAQLHLPGYVRRYLQRTVFIAVPLAVITYLVFLQGKAEHSNAVLIATVLSGLSYGLVMLITGYLTCAGANRLSFCLRSAYAGLSFFIATAMALMSRNILYFFFGMCAAGLATALLAMRMTPGFPRGWWRNNPPAAGVDSSWWFVVPSVLNWFFWYGLVLCVSSYFGTARAAELAFVNNLATVLLLINSAVSQAWVSRYLRLVSHSREAAEQSNALVYRLH